MVLADVQQLAPPTVLAQASRMQFSTRLFNLIVTNVPGPQFPLELLGRQLLDLFPIAFLPKGHGLAIAIMSYNGGVNFGLLGDYDALPDVDLIAEGIEDGLAQLKRAADARQARGAAGGRQPAREPQPEPEPAAVASTSTPPAAPPPSAAPASDAGPQLLPSGPPARPGGPAASMRERARRRRPSANGGEER
jgi:hypothetical protein